MVIDTGVGIPVTELESIFQPFEQSGETQHRFAGSGLGLSISRQLMRLMGSDIWVKSRVGEGSRFGFELALPERATAPATLLSAPRTNGHGESFGLATVIVHLPQKIVAPPVEILKKLRQLAQLGNMRDIIEFAKGLVEIDSGCEPFVTQLCQLAQAYQSKALLVLINEYLHDANSL
jgi:hypothetical protein